MNHNQKRTAVKLTIRILMIAALFTPLYTGAVCRADSGPRVTLISREGARAEVKVEVADTREARRRGLMFRRSLGPSCGMLFVFPHQAFHTIWMKNTFIPLDIIFINDKMRMVGLVENARPNSTELLRVPAPSLYVLEVNAFFCRGAGVREGDSVVIEGVKAKP